MNRRVHGKRFAALLALGSAVFLAGGCDLDGFLQRAGTAFADSFGERAAELLFGELEELLGGGGA